MQAIGSLKEWDEEKGRDKMRIEVAKELQLLATRTLTFSSEFGFPQFWFFR
jgi:hypothetical protein